MVVITFRLITFLTTTTGRSGLTESSALAPSAGSRPPISSKVRKTKVARKRAAIVANTGIADSRRLGLRRDGVTSVVISAFVVVVLVLIVVVLVLVLIVVLVLVAIATRAALRGGDRTRVR